jgi:hypothetical protein
LLETVEGLTELLLGQTGGVGEEALHLVQAVRQPRAQLTHLIADLRDDPGAHRSEDGERADEHDQRRGGGCHTTRLERPHERRQQRREDQGKKDRQHDDLQPARQLHPEVHDDPDRDDPHTAFADTAKRAGRPRPHRNSRPAVLTRGVQSRRWPASGRTGCHRPTPPRPHAVETLPRSGLLVSPPLI